ncbi:MAG: hypothetical protein Q8K93_25785 [Reyranella sp.]|uniref:hypothetical protein n=1 Tax=Reyranella sp. TaxID=1929291 RepID=UPI002730EC05|nr:hypothetical protein [Reyranella sp.]MDP1965606.1 hypothetical protein [Reyranella sp.]MDP2377499.1 hypothetical protein [Reyranella sp.]
MGENAKAVATSPAKLGPLHAAQLVRKVAAALVDLHRRRLSELGIDGSGLFAHYAGLLSQGDILRADEIQAFKLVREALPVYGGYAVLRAGLGELAFLINGAGLRVTACEPNGARVEALKAGLDHLVASKMVDGERFAIAPEFVPDRVDARPLLGVATDFVFDLPLEQDHAFCRGLRQFDGLLINPRLFIRLREQTSEQRAVTAFLQSLGFAEVKKFPTEQMVYYVRPPDDQEQTSKGLSTISAEPAPQGAAGGTEFDALVKRLMALVPPAPSPGTGTTWIERRVRKFDLRSAFGDDE